MSVPINSTGSTIEDLENDLAALECVRQAVAQCLEDGDLAKHVFSWGAAAFEPEAVLAWLEEKIQETENTIESLEGAGPPVNES